MEKSQLKGDYKTLLVAPYGLRKTLRKNIRKAAKRAESAKSIVALHITALYPALFLIAFTQSFTNTKSLLILRASTSTPSMFVLPLSKR